MDESINRVIYIAIGIIIACLVVTALFGFFHISRNMQHSAANTSDDMVHVLSDEEVSRYQATKMLGSQLVDVVQKLSEEEVPMDIQIKATGSDKYLQCNRGTYTAAGEVSRIKNNVPLTQMYIGTCEKDAQGRYTKVIFNFATS